MSFEPFLVFLHHNYNWWLAMHLVQVLVLATLKIASTLITLSSSQRRYYYHILTVMYYTLKILYFLLQTSHMVPFPIKLPEVIYLFAVTYTSFISFLINSFNVVANTASVIFPILSFFILVSRNKSLYFLSIFRGKTNFILGRTLLQ